MRWRRSQSCKFQIPTKPARDGPVTQWRAARRERPAPYRQDAHDYDSEAVPALAVGPHGSWSARQDSAFRCSRSRWFANSAWAAPAEHARRRWSPSGQPWRSRYLGFPPIYDACISRCITDQRSMAGTAPTGFHFTSTRDAGPVHCSVWFFGGRLAALTNAPYKQ